MPFLQFSTVLAQERNNDYYARTPGVNDGLYYNVMGHHYEQGVVKSNKGLFESALGEFEFILDYFPNEPRTLAALSEMCARWRSPVCDQRADYWLQRAVERNPGASQSYVVMAMHLHRKNKIKDALKFYKQALNLAPDSINAHYNLGLAYADLKQYELANKHAQVAYSKGVQLPALRARLQKVGKWDPNVKFPVSESPTAKDSELPAQEPRK